MLRAITDAERLNNRNLCGIDTEFCYPIKRATDVVVYYRLPNPGPWTVGQVIIYDSTGTNSLAVLGPTQLLQYFAVLFATDSNGDTFMALRQIQPMYNWDGVQSELTCYSISVTLQGEEGETWQATNITLITEPVCYVERYCMRHYVIAFSINDVDQLTFNIVCDGVSYSFDYQSVPVGSWIEYTGPFVDLFLPQNCQLSSVTQAGNEQEFVEVETCFGAQSCQSYVRIEGNAGLLYDCFGRYFGEVTDIQEGSNFTQCILRDATDDKRLLLDLLSMNVSNGKVKMLDSKNVPIRVKGSCYISHTEVLDRYKVYSTCPVPKWYQKEVDNVASMQRVILTGSKPLLNDQDEWIELIQAQEYAWQSREKSDYVLPSLIFETCTCYKNYTC